MTLSIEQRLSKLENLFDFDEHSATFKLVSPDGKVSIKISATNDIGGIWAETNNHIVALASISDQWAGVFGYHKNTLDSGASFALTVDKHGGSNAQAMNGSSVFVTNFGLMVETFYRAEAAEEDKSSSGHIAKVR
jgi:hypothetical protein